MVTVRDNCYFDAHLRMPVDIQDQN